MSVLFVGVITFGSLPPIFMKIREVGILTLFGLCVSSAAKSITDRLKFRQAALAAWEEWKTKSPEAAALIEIHKAYMKANGIM